MVGTLTISEDSDNRLDKWPIRKIKLAWLTDASGNATKTIGVSGVLLAIGYEPGTGSTQPDNLYDATVKDSSDTIAYNGSTGADLSNVTATYNALNSNYGYAINGDIKITIANAGSGKTGYIYLYLR